jgi:hypothetical protein
MRFYLVCSWELHWKYTGDFQWNHCCSQFEKCSLDLLMVIIFLLTSINISLLPSWMTAESVVSYVFFSLLPIHTVSSLNSVVNKSENDVVEEFSGIITYFIACMLLPFSFSVSPFLPYANILSLNYHFLRLCFNFCYVGQKIWIKRDHSEMLIFPPLRGLLILSSQMCSIASFFPKLNDSHCWHHHICSNWMWPSHLGQ